MNAAALCDLLSRPLVLSVPRKSYIHGWGENCYGGKPIVSSWTLTTNDRNECPISLTFDLVEGHSPLITVLDIGRHCNVFNRLNPRTIEIKRPTDIHTFSLSTYIPINASERRLRIGIVPAPNMSISSLLVSTQSAGRKQSLSFSKNLHRFTHAHPKELKFLCATANILTPDIGEAIDRIH